jgi:hypothetical protein
MPENTTHILPSDDEIRERVYQIYLKRGWKNGYDLSDWLAAKRELEQAETEPLVAPT